MLAERITAFVRGESDESFDRLALAVFRRQFERHEAYRRLCERRRATPGDVDGWRGVPAVPARAAAGSAAASVDETAAGRAQSELRRAVLERTFQPACLDGLERPPVLSLIRPGGGRQEAAASFPLERVLELWGAPDGLDAARRGVEVARARGFLAARQRDRRPTLILAASAELGRLLEALERRGLRFRLPPGSRVVELGRRRPASGELLSRLAEALAVPPEAVVREYAVPGLVTRLYAGHRQGGEGHPFLPPPWTRVRLLDPERGAETAGGSAGEIAVFDLASAGAAAHLLTGDRGLAADGGFRLAEPEASRGA